MPPCIFIYRSYITQEVALAGRAVVDIALAAELTDLDEVVVVGYSTQKRANVVGSVSSISGESIQSVPSPNVTTSLSGRIPGAVVVQNTGEPGAYGQRIQIRAAVLSEAAGTLIPQIPRHWLLLTEFPDVVWMKLTERY